MVRDDSFAGATICNEMRKIEDERNLRENGRGGGGMDESRDKEFCGKR